MWVSFTILYAKETSRKHLFENTNPLNHKVLNSANTSTTCIYFRVTINFFLMIMGHSGCNENTNIK